MVTIFIDADACKKHIREYLIKFILRKHNSFIQLMIVSNKVIPNIPKQTNIHSIQVSQTPEATDTYILSCAKKGDLAITRDILLAQTLIEKEVTVINELAEIYTKDTIIARKQRATQNAEHRTFIRKEEQLHSKHATLPPYVEKEKQKKKEIAKFAHYLNTWKQCM